MKRPTIFAGLIVALVITGASVLTYTCVAVIFNPFLAMRLIICGAVCTYGAVLLVSAGSRVGRGLAASFLLLGQGGLFVLGAPAVILAIVGALQIWFIRSLLFARGILEWCGDAAIVALGFAAALYIAQSGYGLAGIIWGFLLVQSLFVLVPAVKTALINLVFGSTDRTASTTELSNTQFDKAARSAEAAMRRLVTE